MNYFKDLDNCLKKENIITKEIILKNIDRTYLYRIKKQYGVNELEYNLLFEKQKGRCHICDTHQSELVKRLSVDHCHLTKKVRGLLCFNCNSGIGKFKDNEALLQKAIEYLQESKKETINLN